MIGLNRVKTWILDRRPGRPVRADRRRVRGSAGDDRRPGHRPGRSTSRCTGSATRSRSRPTRSKPVTEQEAPELYRIVRELTQANQMPMPRIYVSDMMQPNAFATGRNPEHAVGGGHRRGSSQILDERELRGVLAHELSHVANRDILIGSIAAAIGMSITFLARFAALVRLAATTATAVGIVGLLLAWVLAPDRGRDHPDGREPLARVPGRRVRRDPLARPRGAGERAPQARGHRRARSRCRRA